MGFFKKMFQKGDAKSKKEATTPFKPVVVKTTHVGKTLQNASEKFSLPLSRLDFHLIQTLTSVKMDENSEWTEVDPDDWPRIHTPEILLNPHFQIRQEHEIEIRLYQEEAWEKDLFLQVAADKQRSRIEAILRSGTVLYGVEGLKEKLIDLIRKKMLKAGMLIDLWENHLESGLDEATAKALVEGEVTLHEDLVLEAARCYAAVPAVDDALILRYKQKYANEDDQGRIDFSKRGFIQAVEEGEVIIEYVKPKPGRPGRNCMGEFIPVSEPKESHRPDFSVSEHIAVEESEEKILYKARRGGYVVFENGVYDIRDEMEVEEVSFKTTGSIEAGIETDVKIRVHERDWMKDAIGTGVEVEAADVKVEGNVGASALVRAESIEIGGQTHQSSKIYAEEARVNVLRGYLEAKKSAHVTRLEGGEIVTARAEVSQMIGGEIRGLDVHVEVMGANCKIYAVRQIEIGKMQGENNKLIIDAAEIPAYHDEIARLEQKQEKLSQALERTKETWQERTALYEKSEPAIRTLKQKILEEKRRGIQPKSAYVIKIRQFQKLAEKVADLKEEISKIEAELEDVRKKLTSYQTSVLRAVVRNRGAWQEYTSVVFRLLTPPMELEYRPKAGAEGEEIYLEQIEDEGFEVAVRKIEK